MHESANKPTAEERSAAEEAALLEDVAALLATYDTRRGNLLPILQAIQHRHSYLSSGAMKKVAEHLSISYVEVFGVASFYNQFRFHPPGKHQIKVCLGTACHVRAGDIILENFERKLGIKEGETTADREFSIERVACVGCCALAPVALVNEYVHGKMQPSKVEGLILQIDIEKERKEREKRSSEPE
ncbi:MAG: NADH-quinone oxidoreductase subunit NuoE [Deltaproteobacteria bacterium]|nr:NADH-quinone oxidoreductase subunit NuoE [Deltaproteobacteria bacterium]